MGKVFKPQPPVIFCDIDGVVAAWSEAVFDLFGVALPAPPTEMPYDVEKIIGVTTDEMWDRINALGSGWWEDLPPYVWTADLLAALGALGPPVVFLTSPDTLGHSASGKVRWIRRVVSPHCRNYIITAQKHLLAHPRAVLVDDSDDKLAKFAEYGGGAVVFPRQWNSGGYVKAEDIVAHTLTRVRTAFLHAGVRL